MSSRKTNTHAFGTQPNQMSLKQSRKNQIQASIRQPKGVMANQSELDHAEVTLSSKARTACHDHVVIMSWSCDDDECIQDFQVRTMIK